MRIALKSDFDDYYDHAFLTPRHQALDWTWERMSRDGVRRRHALWVLEQLGFAVPRHGIVAELVPILLRDTGVPEMVVGDFLGRTNGTCGTCLKTLMSRSPGQSNPPFYSARR
jgi:hypothetical protein